MPMLRRMIASLLLTALVALGSGVLPQRHILPARAAQSPTPRVLYNATWRPDLLGWRQESADWRVVKGLLTCVCGLSEQTNQGIIVAPYKLGHLARFALDVSMRVDAVTPGVGASLAVIARTAPHPDSALGVHAGDAFYEAGGGPTWAAELWYGGNGGDPLSASLGALPAVTSLDQTHFNPNHHWHTYRLEVRGRSYKLFIDGVAVLSATDIHFLFLPDQRVGLTADACTVSVSRFRILAL